MAAVCMPGAVPPSRRAGGQAGGRAFLEMWKPIMMGADHVVTDSDGLLGDWLMSSGTCMVLAACTTRCTRPCLAGEQCGRPCFWVAEEAHIAARPIARRQWRGLRERGSSCQQEAFPNNGAGLSSPAHLAIWAAISRSAL